MATIAVSGSNLAKRHVEIEISSPTFFGSGSGFFSVVCFGNGQYYPRIYNSVLANDNGSYLAEEMAMMSAQAQKMCFLLMVVRTRIVNGSFHDISSSPSVCPS